MQIKGSHARVRRGHLAVAQCAALLFAMLMAESAAAQLDVSAYLLRAAVDVRPPRPSLRDDELSSLQFIDHDNNAATPPVRVLADDVADAEIFLHGANADFDRYGYAVQRTTSNALLLQQRYLSGESVEMTAATTWQISLVNNGTSPEPVDFSFFLSGGGLSLWKVIGFGAPVSASVVARIGRGDPSLPAFWSYQADLVGKHNGSGGTLVDLSETLQDPLGMGGPTASYVKFGEPDPSFDVFKNSTIADISSFHGSARLGELAPGDSLTISYELLASILGPGESYAYAWLVDPFNLGAPGELPSAQWAINGVPVEAMLPAAAPVPLPSAWLLLLTALPLCRLRRATDAA